mgnify:CR=1 FL=1
MGMIIKRTETLTEILDIMSSDKNIDFYFTRRQKGVTTSYLIGLLGKINFSLLIFFEERYPCL